MRVNFSGIYMIKFPQTESKDTIKTKANTLQEHIEKNNLSQIASAMYRENIKPAKKGQNTSDILLTSSIDNPSLMYSTLNSIGLGDQYIDKTRIYLEA